MFCCNSAHEHEIASGVKASLEGFVTVHKGSCEQEFQIPRPVAEGLGVLFANARVYVAQVDNLYARQFPRGTLSAGQPQHVHYAQECRIGGGLL